MLLTLQSLIPWPPSSPRLQSAEACFMGGTYPALSLYTGYVPLQVGMVWVRFEGGGSEHSDLLYQPDLQNIIPT